jgi:hypothetical protein
MATNLKLTPRSPVDADAEYDTICFRVPVGFKRRVKVFAATHGMKLGALLQKAFNAYEAAHGGRDERR